MNPGKLERLRIDGGRARYTQRDARLYALSLCFAGNPLDERELDFVVDRPGFKVVPTMAVIFAEVIVELTKACEFKRPELALHGQQTLELFAPLPAEAELEISGSIPLIFDRGAERGAEVHMVAEARLAGEAQPLYRTTYVTIARGDGGFGGEPPQHNAASVQAPDRPPDKTGVCPTRRNQALLYALNGDPNPIHTQPRIARKAGFDVPIMHGLGTYGIACRSILENHCDYESSRIRRFDARFSAPVLPGDTLAIESWDTEHGVVFQARARERDQLVLKQGLCILNQPNHPSRHHIFSTGKMI